MNRRGLFGSLGCKALGVVGLGFLVNEQAKAKPKTVEKFVRIDIDKELDRPGAQSLAECAFAMPYPDNGKHYWIRGPWRPDVDKPERQKASVYGLPLYSLPHTPFPPCIQMMLYRPCSKPST